VPKAADCSCARTGEARLALLCARAVLRCAHSSPSSPVRPSRIRASMFSSSCSRVTTRRHAPRLAPPASIIDRAQRLVERRSSLVSRALAFLQVARCGPPGSDACAFHIAHARRLRPSYLRGVRESCPHAPLSATSCIAFCSCGRATWRASCQLYVGLTRPAVLVGLRLEVPPAVRTVFDFRAPISVQACLVGRARWWAGSSPRAVTCSCSRWCCSRVVARSAAMACSMLFTWRRPA